MINDIFRLIIVTITIKSDTKKTLTFRPKIEKVIVLMWVVLG